VEVGHDGLYALLGTVQYDTSDEETDDTFAWVALDETVRDEKGF